MCQAGEPTLASSSWQRQKLMFQMMDSQSGNLRQEMCSCEQEVKYSPLGDSQAVIWSLSAWKSVWPWIFCCEIALCESMAWLLRSYPAGVYQELAEAISLLMHVRGPGVSPQQYAIGETNLLKPQADTGFSLYTIPTSNSQKSLKRLTGLLPLLKILSLFN